MSAGAVAAVDLGASSGRVMLGHVGPDVLALQEVARFRNGGVPVGGGAEVERDVALDDTSSWGSSEEGALDVAPEVLHWDALGLWQDVVTGLSQAARAAQAGGREVVSVGVDTWAIDYGLLDARGILLGNPRHYRDRRTDGVAERLFAGDAYRAPVDRARLYRLNGLQHLPFTTLYQLVAEQQGALLGAAETLLLVPDLLGFWLSGHRGAERTNASTTGLLDVTTGDWSDELLAVAGVSRSLLAPVHEPGAVLGGLRPKLRESACLPTAVLTSVGSHDTASAVVAVPARDERFAYIACGTWGLVGVELEAPVLTEASRVANFTNEGGVDGRVRYLRNVMGLWVLSSCVAEWTAESSAGGTGSVGGAGSANGTGSANGAGSAGAPAGLPALLAAAAALPAGGPVIDIDDPSFLPAGPMVARVQRACEVSGAAVPTTRPQIVRCVVESLAVAFARTLEDAVRQSGREVDVVHLVGGGALNTLLCQLTADACGRPVLAGPVEATALGNVLVQARAHGLVRGSLEDLRALVRGTHDVVTYQPTSHPART